MFVFMQGGPSQIETIRSQDDRPTSGSASCRRGKSPRRCRASHSGRRFLSWPRGLTSWRSCVRSRPAMRTTTSPIVCKATCRSESRLALFAHCRHQSGSGTGMPTNGAIYPQAVDPVDPCRFQDIWRFLNRPVALGEPPIRGWRQVAGGEIEEGSSFGTAAGSPRRSAATAVRVGPHSAVRSIPPE